MIQVRETRIIDRDGVLRKFREDFRAHAAVIRNNLERNFIK